VLRRRDWTIAGPGRVYDFPRTRKGKRRYCTVEGICWLSPTRFVAVSDLASPNCSERCRKTQQSIHIFSLPRRFGMNVHIRLHYVANLWIDERKQRPSVPRRSIE
jgi:hypothetical protein